MRHKMLTHRALFCIDLVFDFNAKKGHAESAFCDACRTSAGCSLRAQRSECRVQGSLHISLEAKKKGS